MHGLAKRRIISLSGIVEQNTGTKDITKMGGPYKTMPVTAMAFLFLLIFCYGIPHLAVFFSKYMVITGAIMKVRQ